MSRDIKHPDYEHEDVRPRGVFEFAVGFVIAIVVVFVVVWWMYGYIRRRDEMADVRRSLIPPASSVPPGPRLQVNPAEELQAFKKEQDQILNSYGWVSREDGRVRIPIERAMELVVQGRFLPVPAKKEEKK